MTGDGAIEVVTRLYGAAHWQVGESDYTIWDEALSDIPDDEALTAAVEMIGHLDPNEVRYTPALLRATVSAARLRARATIPALPEDTSHVACRDSRTRGLAEAKAALSRAKGPLADDLRRAIRTPNADDFDEAGELR